MVEEKRPADCPVDVAWLKRMNEVLPPRIWERSKLANLEKCLTKALREAAAAKATE